MSDSIAGRRLGDIFKVTRGTVTGDRPFFVMSKDEAKERGLAAFAVPVITSAREFSKTDVVRDTADRAVVIVIPRGIDRQANPAVDQWLRSGEGGVTSRNTAWWSFGAKRPPAAATYKGGLGPRLVANPDRMVLLNIAYALEPITPKTTEGVATDVKAFNLYAPKWPFPNGRSLGPREIEAMPLG